MPKPKPPEVLYSGHGWRMTLDHALLPDGRVDTTARVHRCDVVNVLAFSNESSILLIREFRPHFGHYLWMLPGGKVDKETDITIAAQRELREETGYRSDDLQYYCSCNNWESVSSTNHIFLAWSLTKDTLPGDATELIEVHTLPLEDALAKVLGCAHTHTPSAFALLRYLREHN